MLDWMKGNEQGTHATDDSKLLEPPETPGHVFAIRAFKSALFGTPGAEDDQKHASKKQHDHQRSKSDTIKLAPTDIKIDTNSASEDATCNPGSPTKSILVTPGTALRRKTVSFGESVIDNEGKRPGSASKPAKTPPNPSGTLSTQWMSGSSDGSGKPRSKLTQTLMNARDNASKNSTSTKSNDSTGEAKSDIASGSKDIMDNEDLTINLEDPHSESGKYWKTEFDNYRVRTNREIKKLIHYRSIAKSYARKKDSEAMRLADKLKEEEEKVAEMERQVSRLASSMVGEGSIDDKEHLVQDLTKQTALALQYKQQATSLRKALERHDIVSDAATSAQTKKDSPSEAPTDELLRTQQELKQANAKIEEMQRQQSQLSTLRNLAQSSEKKAETLEQENNSLKQTLARVKQEMSRYEGRRKDKETRLKQREARLEQRIQEYRERLKTVSQEHRASMENLRNTSETERRHLQKQIDLLKLRLGSTERFPALPSTEREFLSPRKGYTGVQVFDFADDHTGQDLEDPEEPTEDIESPPSPSPRSKVRNSRPALRSATLGTRFNTLDMGAEDDEVTHYLNEILTKPRHESNNAAASDEVPPSSPPDIPTLRSLNRTFSRRRLGDGQRSYRNLNLPDDDTRLSNRQAQRERTHIKSTLDSISSLPYRSRYSGNTVSAGERVGKRYELADMKREALSPERIAAAKSRLRQKGNRRMKASGKENV
ncbi:Spindle-body formation-associated protein [Penicillium bovifimosum]|uniref:Spindle-body formation-associated protein n=1 Tax=Penicillium bovifimosum TaxID=126998 RepID=A0A9W9LBX3_9EURO|nr:Spindle-body formation-associated protein [Penicillium bovifimosum]KAJ5146273.1 Spindle-body formation-associated protein [Penicillium bovifimosum]